MNQPLLLQVPKQHEFHNPAVELNPKRLAAWLNELPLLNLGRSAKALLEGLSANNLQPMPAKTRMRLLELYRETFVAIFDGLDDQALRGQPLAPEQRSLARQSGAALCRELANGYKLLVRELHGQDPRRQPLLHPALYRALEAVALTLLDAFRSYQVAPTFAYLELHQLHLLGEEFGLLQAPVQLEKRRLSDTGMGALYQRLLMLSVTDPYHLPAGAALKLYRLLETFAAHAQLRAYEGIAPAGCYIVERGGDSPPIAAARAHSDYGFEQPAVLDLRPALELVLQRLAKLRAQHPAEDEQSRLLSLLTPQLEPPRQRQAPRRVSRRAAWVSFGIEAVHHYLSRGARYIAQAMADSDNAVQVRDIGSEDDAAHALEPWQIVNESVSGYLLASASRWQGEPRVGDAVAVVTASKDPNEPRLAVAVVRWMRAGRNQTVEMGIELIPGNVRAVQCESDVGTGPALLFSSVPALRLPASLVTPKGSHQADRPLRLRSGNRISSIQVGALMQATAYVEQFNFEPAG